MLPALLQRTVLEPIITGPLLLALQRLPPSALARLSPALVKIMQSPRTLKAVMVFFVLGITRRASNSLSHLALNHWQTNSTWDWKKEVVVITGGSSGIGDKVTADLASRGIKLIILDIQAPISPLASNTFFFQTDVTSPSSVKAVAEQIRRVHGNPTVLINNAGVASGTLLLDEDADEKVRRVFNVNTIAHFTLVREFVPNMVRRNHGHIVTIASMASFLSLGGMVDYACTKASALAFHEGLTQELRYWYNAPKWEHISNLCGASSIIHPSWVRTPMTKPMTDASKKFKDEALRPETVAEYIVNQILSGKSGQIILPASVTSYTTIRGLPSWIQEIIRAAGSKIMIATSKA